MKTATEITTKIDESAFRALLQKELISRIKSNPQYSLRSFAQALKIDASTLSKLLSGKRKLGKKVMSGLSTKLGLPELRNQEFNQNTGFSDLSIDHFIVIKDWYHLALLELLSLDDFQNDEAWMARKLGIKTMQVKAALQRLERLEMVTKNKKGRWIDTTGGRTSTLNSIDTHAALRTMQKQLLEKAMIALETVSIKERLQNSVCFAIDTDRLPEALEDLLRLRREFSKKYANENSKKNSVYNLTVSFFPLTKGVNHVE